MSLDTIPSVAPTHAGRSQPGRVQGKVKAAVLAMAWEGLTFTEAARKANLSAYAMRLALERSHVQAYLRSQRQVFRSSLTDRATHRLVELSEQDTHKAAAVTATISLMNEHDQSVASGSIIRAPGLQIVIVQQSSPSHALPNASVIDAAVNDIKDLDGNTNS